MKHISKPPKITRRPRGYINPLLTDSEREKRREAQAVYIERAKERKNRTVDPNLFNAEKYNNWLC